MQVRRLQSALELEQETSAQHKDEAQRAIGSALRCGERGVCAERSWCAPHAHNAWLRGFA